MECFKKALKITDASFSSKPNKENFHLYIAILNKFLYYFNHDDFQAVRRELLLFLMFQIKADDVNKCIEVIKQKLGSIPEKDHPYLNNTFEYILCRQKESEKYQAIVI